MTDPVEYAAGDLWVLEQPEPRAGLFSSIGEGVRQGAIGVATDWVNLLAPWGFSLAEIEVPVHIWHGGQDSWVQLADCERVVAAIPHAALTIWPDAGHLARPNTGPTCSRRPLTDVTVATSVLHAFHRLDDPHTACPDQRRRGPL